MNPSILLDCGDVNSAPTTRFGHNKVRLKPRPTIKFRANHFVHRRHVSNAKLEMHYQVGALLGQGGFGSVYACTHLTTGTARAVKIIEKSSLSAEEQESVVREFQILKDLDHPNLLKLYEMLEDSKSFYLITDVYQGGELFQAIVERGCVGAGGFSENDAAILIKRVLGCINYCHQQNVVHRDLKPENILLAGNHADPKDIRIIDFGLAKKFAIQDDFSTRSLHAAFFSEVAGSPYYISPQVLDGHYTAKCDIWSIGVITFVLLAGYPPFCGETDDEILHRIDEGKVEFKYPVWDSISDQAKDFIKYLLTYNEKDRPTADEALRHSWFASRETASCAEHRHDSVRTSLRALKQHSKGPTFGKLKQAACAYIASQLLPRQQKEEIDLLFRALDQDLDGNITEEDIVNSHMQSFGESLSDDDIKSIIKSVNHSSSGAIEYSEFVVAVMMVKNMVNREKLEAAFDHFDVHQTGFITVEGLKKVLHLEDSMDKYIVNNIIYPADADGDGKISKKDFETMMAAVGQPHQRLRRSSKREMFRTAHPAVDNVSLETLMEGFDFDE